MMAMLKISRRRRELRILNAEAWADFKEHWPADVLWVLRDCGGGFLFGVALGLAAVVQVVIRF